VNTTQAGLIGTAQTTATEAKSRAEALSISLDEKYYILEGKIEAGDDDVTDYVNELTNAMKRTLQVEYAAADAAGKLEIIQMNTALETKLNNLLNEHGELSNDLEDLQIDLANKFTELSQKDEELAGKISSEVESLEDALSSEVESLEDDMESAVDDLDAKDKELADDLEDLEGAVNAKDEELAADIEDIEDLLAELKADKQLDELKGELEHDKLTEELAALKEELARTPDETGHDISQHVNIDLDVGHLKDDSFLETFEGLDLEWWQYALVGLGFVMVMVAKCLFIDRGQSQDRGGPLLPF